ncbi:hypothetical protein PZN02_003202 [Sinorhizobium garamanticum]|uniref:Uncharacterized protein n=1 Tax=Sinorhizobium garamanticum TaxID=680247 RepID=A0ABY8D7L0_9HYPH|nr:hypothetical protein [Sinorhizobium garamanticum]WEX86865.1 hypothetical protein PZN02_003202 [Sinorhizobium garamanticum]
MVAKSNKANATQAAARRLEKVIASHRIYFSDWRSHKFDEGSSSREAERSNQLRQDSQKSK